MRLLKYLLPIFLIGNVFASQQNWTGNVSGLTVNANDTLNVTGNVTLDASVTCKAIWFPSGQTYTMAKSGTRTITLTGNGLFWKDSSSGAKTYPDSFAITGSGTMRFYGGAVTSTSTKWYFAGNDSLISGVTLGGALLHIGASGYCYHNSASTTTITAGSGYSFIIGNNGTLNSAGGGLNFRKNANGDFYSLGSGYTITGASSSSWSVLGNAVKVTFPAMVWGMGAVTLRGGGTADTGLFTGNCDFGSAALNLQAISATVQMTIDLGSANITCGIFRYGQSTAALTTGWYNMHFGSGTLTCSSFGNVADSLAGANVNFDSKICKVGGNIILPKNMTLTSGTETFVSTATASMTSNGHDIYNLVDSLGNFTLADACIINGNANFKSTGTLSITPGITMTGNSKTITLASSLGAVTSSTAPIVWNGTSGTLTDNKGITIQSWTTGGGGDCSFNGSAGTTITNGSTSIVLGSGTALQNSFVINGSNFTCQNSTLKSYGNFTIGAQTFARGTSKLYFYGATNSTVTANENRFYDRVDSMDNGKKVTLGDNQYHNTHVIKNGSFDFAGKIDTVIDNFSVTNIAGDTISAMGSGSSLVLTKANTVNFSLLGTGRKRLDSLSIYINKNIVIASDSNFAIKKIVTANHGGTKYTFPCNKQISLFRPVDYDFSGTSTFDTIISTEACSLAYILLVNGNKYDSALYIKNISVSGGSLICSTNCIDGGGNSGILFGAQPVTDTVPIIDSISPAGAIFRDTVTLHGSVFGSAPNGYLNGALVPYVSRDSVHYTFTMTDQPARGNIPFVIVNTTYNTRDTIQFFIFYNPRLASVTPNHGKTAGGDTVEIRCDSCGAVDTVWFQNDPAIPFSVTDSLVKAISPGHAAGSVLIAVHDTNGYNDTLPAAYEYNNLYGWTVTHPASLDTAGGDTIKFHSEYGQVTAATVFTFDGSITALTTNTDTLSTYITPAHAPGVVPWVFDALGTVKTGSVRYRGGGRSAVKLYYKIY